MKIEGEDDAQHSWHISVMAMILGEYSNKKIDMQGNKNVINS